MFSSALTDYAHFGNITMFSATLALMTLALVTLARSAGAASIPYYYAIFLSYDLTETSHLIFPWRYILLLKTST